MWLHGFKGKFQVKYKWPRIKTNLNICTTIFFIEFGISKCTKTCTFFNKQENMTLKFEWFASSLSVCSILPLKYTELTDAPRDSIVAMPIWATFEGHACSAQKPVAKNKTDGQTAVMSLSRVGGTEFIILWLLKFNPVFQYMTSMVHWVGGYKK